MNIDFNLEYSFGFKWNKSEKIIFKGSFFYNDDNYFNSNTKLNNDLLELFKDIKTESDFTFIIEKLNGIFSIILIINDTLYIAVDKVRYFPLFFSNQNNTLFISDKAEDLAKKLFLNDIDEISKIEYMGSGHTLGNKTLLKDVFQINSSEILTYLNNTVKLSTYFNYCVKDFDNNLSSFSQLINQTENIIEKVFARMIKSLDGKTIALPLSGGYDSRLIAVMLKFFNYENVICFTYGRKGSEEIELSHKTAEKLGYKWLFIEYTDSLIMDFIKDPLFQNYFKFSANHTSMLFLQEYFAVKYLKENSLIPENTIFIPGHSGDFLAGSQLLKNEIKENEKNFEVAIKNIINKRFKLYNNAILSESSLNDIKSSFKEKSLENYTISSIYEDFDWKEKISKIIFNASKAFDYFDYEVRFPFADNEIIDFFKHIPYKYRENKKLYDKVIKENYFNKYNINFNGELSVSKNMQIKQNIKEKIKRFIPNSIINKKLKIDDKFFHKEITELLILDMIERGKKKPTLYGGYNSILINWYLSQIEN